MLVNAAGVAAVEKVHGRDGPHQLASFQKVIQVNLLGSFNMMRPAAAAMLASPARPGTNEIDSRGVIGEHGLDRGLRWADGSGGMCVASKGGVVAMTLLAARDLARDRIRVMTVAPGVFHTPMMALPEAACSCWPPPCPTQHVWGQPDEVRGPGATSSRTITLMAR